jgi:hypothetical protein
MGKNRSLFAIFGVFAVGWIVSAAFTGADSMRPSDPIPTEPRTQIVVQWMIDATGDISLGQVWTLEDTLEAESDGRFEVDGHDFGSGTANVFLFSTDPDRAVERIVQIFQSGLLRPGMRIGVAQYTNPERTDWTYRPTYPPGLDRFDITY